MTYRTYTRGWPLADRLAFFTEPPDERGCTVWNGNRSPDGYGRIKIQRRYQMATHVVWETATGTKVPSDMRVLHHCDNPPCVNIDHLSLGTQLDNAADRVAKGRSARLCGVDNPRSRFTEDDVIDMRRAWASGERLVDIARRHNTERSSIWAIVHRRTWRHLP